MIISRWVALLACAHLMGCGHAAAQAPPTLASTPVPAATAAPSPTPTDLPPTPTPSPAPTATPADPFYPISVQALMARGYGGTGIHVTGLVEDDDLAFRQYSIRYSSDGLAITGLMNIPTAGEGPFPVVVIGHGYLSPAIYEPGDDTRGLAASFARAGYLTLMPDYRNYAGSEAGPNPFNTGYVIDVLNLIAQLDTLPQAAPGQVGLIGHSMGGEIAQWVMLISDEVDGVVLYAAMSGDAARNWQRAFDLWPAQRDEMEALALIYGQPAANPAGYALISPQNYYDQVRIPVMIHHGAMDEWVPYAWSQEAYDLMQAAGADVTFHGYPGGRHTLTGSDYRLMLERTLEFFARTVLADVNSPTQVSSSGSGPR